MRRLGPALAALALALTGGCSLGGEEAGRGKTAPGPAATEPATTDAAAPAPPPKRIWLGRYALWVTDVRAALEKAGSLQHRQGRPVTVRLEGDLEEALDELRACRTTLRERLEPPPPAFARSVLLLRRACSRFAEGAQLDTEALEASRPELYARVFAVWSRASDLVQRANTALPQPEATERLPVPVGGGLLSASRVEPLFSAVADEHAAPAAQIRCWAEPDWTTVKIEAFGKSEDLAGFASPDFQRANLDPRICRWLATLAYTPSRPGGIDQLEIAFALDTLMHESGHLNESGDFFGAGANEPLAECWGMQHIRQAALALGATRAYAAELAERYWEEVYPTRPRDYRSPRCRNGGPYDVRPGSDVWP